MAAVTVSDRGWRRPPSARGLSGAGAGAAAQRRGGVRVRGGVVAGDAGELLGAGGGGRARGLGPDAGPAQDVCVVVEGPAGGAAGLAAGWLPDDEGDLIGPGIAIDETAHLKHGDDTACVAPKDAGCT